MNETKENSILNFKTDNFKVSTEELIPLAPKARCLWVMKCTAMAYELGIRMKEKGEQNTEAYINYNYSINSQLGHLEYELRNLAIQDEEFQKRCEEVYQKYGINFDVLRDNLKALEKSKQYEQKLRAYIEENYYKFEYDETGHRKKTTLDKESEKLDFDLSNRLKKQVEDYRENKLQKQKQEKLGEKGEARN